MPKIKTLIGGKEVEVELSVDQLAEAGGDELKAKFAPAKPAAQPAAPSTQSQPAETPILEVDKAGGPLGQIASVVEVVGNLAKVVNRIEQNLGTVTTEMETTKKEREQAAQNEQATKAKTKADELFKHGVITKEEVESVTKSLEANYEAVAPVYDKVLKAQGVTASTTQKPPDESEKSGEPSGGATYTEKEIEEMPLEEFDKKRKSIEEAYQNNRIIQG